MSFLIFVAVAATAYFAWRIVDRLPDILYRLTEIQRELADLREALGTTEGAPADEAPPAGDEAPASDRSTD